MHIDAEHNAAGVTLRVSGRLDTASAAPFQERLTATLAASSGAVVIDLAGVDYVSSAGLRAVLVAGKAMRAAGRSLSLVALQPPVRTVFDISGFSALFNIS